MTVKKKYRIVKVGLDYEPQFKPPQFAPVPKLFMELLENKAKIKPHLRDADFESKNQSSEINIPSLQDNIRMAAEETKNELINNDETTSNNIQRSHSKPPHIELEAFANASGFAKSYSSPNQYATTPSSFSRTSNKDEFFDLSQSATTTNSTVGRQGFLRKHQSILSKLDQSESQKASPISSREKYDPNPSSNSKSAYIGDEDINLSFSKPKEEKPKEDDIFKLMREGENEESNHKESNHKESINKEYVPSSFSIPPPPIAATNGANLQQDQPPPVSNEPLKIPSLNKIIGEGIKPPSSSTGGAPPINLSYSNTDQELSKKRNLLFKIKRIREEYPKAIIPDVSEFTELRELERIIEDNTRQISIDGTVENYKKYLIIGFFGLEFILSTFLKFDDIRGFAQQQMMGINQYDKLLIEIGEKQSIVVSANWPPEVRLGFMVFMNAAIFLGTKMLFKATGENILNMMGGSGAGSPFGGFGKQSPPQTSKSKMRGPDIDLDFDNFDVKKNK
jgi:hypothetical protein